MEIESVCFVRLESCIRRGMYLAAEDNKTGVSLRAGHRASSDIIWRAEAAVGASGEAVLLLRGGYGNYLVASDRPAPTGPPGAVVTEQNNNPDKSAPALKFLWKIFKNDGYFVVQNLTGQFRRAGGKFLRWRKTVTADPDNSSSMLRWSVEVPLEPDRLPCFDLQENSEALIKASKKQLHLKKFNKKELKKKKKDVEAKLFRLMSQQQKLKEGSGNLLKLYRIDMDVEISTKASHAYDRMIAEADARIIQLKRQEMPKWRKLTHQAQVIRALS